MAGDRRSAIVIGATGLVGSELVRQLLDDGRFASVVALGRRRTGAAHAKLREQVVDFDRPESFGDLVRGDVLFSALGTTVRAAGGQQPQYRVDHDYPLYVAEAARRNGVPALVLVSAAGSSPRSAIFYSRMKGELERDVEALGFPRLRILRPGLLDGDRRERRALEQWTLRILRPLSPLLPASAKPIHASIVVRAAVAAALDETPGSATYEPADLFRLGRR